MLFMKPVQRSGLLIDRGLIRISKRPLAVHFKRYVDVIKPNLNIRSVSVKTDNIDWNPMKTQRQLDRASAPKKGKKVVLGLLCLTPVITFFLGCWQLERLKWKNSLVAECEDRLTYNPAPLPKSVMPEDVPDFEYRKVLVTGRYDYDHEMLVGPRLLNGQRGYLLITPFIRSSDGKKIIVDRGWISADKVNPNTRTLHHLSVPEGEITIQCMLRVPPKKGMFHIDHEPNTKIFRYLDLDAMAKQNNALPIYAQVIQDFSDHPEYLPENRIQQQENGGSSLPGSSWKFWSHSSNTNSSISNINQPDQNTNGVPAAAPTYSFDSPTVAQMSKTFDSSIQFDEHQFISAGVPLGKIPTVDYRNTHLQYVVTWWGISISSAILLAIVFKKRKIVNPLQEKLRHASKTM
ncbi:hypothetical protein PACTADRAFT_51140 [Pachysolen tannophilus NRRL Y-2460]|uniref:SURF1-like protein n=1 Tax=Pachysolen tannophilus NRRL Y-2460 TaxID=669874 RepID=A0A1E4TR89_PACTA|nr:hypothetical protein PACTADRAFT_51140 [Pachysolen tannophilus NRRL Y-2460]